MTDIALSADQATQNAVRLLQSAEGETNLAVMEALTRCAEIWCTVAGLLREAE